jgi:hypothetical protein
MAWLMVRLMAPASRENSARLFPDELGRPVEARMLAEAACRYPARVVLTTVQAYDSW